MRRRPRATALNEYTGIRARSIGQVGYPDRRLVSTMD